jgi:hypothetical protein
MLNDHTAKQQQGELTDLALPRSHVSSRAEPLYICHHERQEKGSPYYSGAGGPRIDSLGASSQSPYSDA